MSSYYFTFSVSHCILVQELAAELGVEYIETSAATGEGVSKAVHKLLDLVMYRIETKCQVHKLLHLFMYRIKLSVRYINYISLKNKTKCQVQKLLNLVMNRI